MKDRDMTRVKYVLSHEKLVEVLANAWNSGFDDSGEGYNGEYLPVTSRHKVHEECEHTVKDILSQLDDHVLEY